MHKLLFFVKDPLESNREVIVIAPVVWWPRSTFPDAENRVQSSWTLFMVPTLKNSFDIAQSRSVFKKGTSTRHKALFFLKINLNKA